MHAARLRAAAALRREHGFGLIELLIAMTVLATGILAIFSVFLSSELAIRRASIATTAMSIVDVRMEALRSARFSAIGHTATALAATDSTYQADPAYRAADANGNTVYNETNEAVTLVSSSLTPTSTVTGADGRSYRVDTYLTWQPVPGGRNVKRATIVVRDPVTPTVTRARAATTFDLASGS